MFKVIHITNKAEAFANVITTMSPDSDQLSLGVKKIDAEKAREIVKDQHVVIDIDINLYPRDVMEEIKTHIVKDLGIPDIEEDELYGQIEDVEYNFDDVILFIDVDYNDEKWVPTYYRVDILI